MSQPTLIQTIKRSNFILVSSPTGCDYEIIKSQQKTFMDLKFSKQTGLRLVHQIFWIKFFLYLGKIFRYTSKGTGQVF